MILGVDPKIDYAFRKLFGNQANSALLIDLLNAVLKESLDQPIVAVDILLPINEKDIATDKETILDIKARDQTGRLYNIEMEMSASSTFPNRALYYWAVVHGGQLDQGEDYDELRPTFSICFVNRVLFPQVADFRLEFQLRSRQHPELIFCGDQAVHIIELPKFRRLAEELAEPLDAWCYFLKHGETMDTDNLPAPLTQVAVPQAIEVLTMLKQNKLEWYRYQSELRAQRDRRSDLKEAREEGLEEGHAKGLEEGHAKGREEGHEEGVIRGDLVGHIRAHQAFLKLPVTPREELLALSLDQLKAKAAVLEQELFARTNGTP